VERGRTASTRAVGTGTTASGKSSEGDGTASPGAERSYRDALVHRLFGFSSDRDLVCREFLADRDQGGLYQRNPAKGFVGK
jgi:hypothetical protein